MDISTCTLDGRVTSNRYDDSAEDDVDDLYDLITEFFVTVHRWSNKYNSTIKSPTKSSKLFLRSSIFPHVAPCIEFRYLNEYNSKNDRKEVNGNGYFDFHPRWEVTPTTPSIVRKIVQVSGFELVTTGGVGCWGGWYETMHAYEFKALLDHQKVNHFPGSYEIGHKDRLCRNISRLMSKHGERRFDFVPKSFVLPQDMELLSKVCGEKDDVKKKKKKKKGSKSFPTKSKWILKPPTSSRGRGIKLIGCWTEIPRSAGDQVMVVQRYLSRPKLFDGNKFDLRLYVLVTSYDPLRIYCYEDGLVRFACSKYKNSLSTLNDRYIHLTNYSVNRHSGCYVDNNDVDSCVGHKWSLKRLWRRFSEQGLDTSKLLSRIDDMIVKTIAASESTVSGFTRVYTVSSYNTYELFGFDVLIDENSKPWLLEVNLSPSLQIPSRLDEIIKGSLLKDVFNLVGYRVPSFLPSSSASFSSLNPRRSKLEKTFNARTICHNFKLHDRSLTNFEKVKQRYFARQNRREVYLRDILNDLTPDDIRQLTQYEDEIRRAGAFRKIFPTATSYKYFEYLDCVSYYNRLFDAWETADAAARSDGLQRLKLLCEKRYHLSRCPLDKEA